MAGFTLNGLIAEKKEKERRGVTTSRPYSPTQKKRANDTLSKMVEDQKENGIGVKPFSPTTKVKVQALKQNTPVPISTVDPVEFAPTEQEIKKPVEAKTPFEQFAAFDAGQKMGGSPLLPSAEKFTSDFVAPVSAAKDRDTIADYIGKKANYDARETALNAEKEDLQIKKAAYSRAGMADELKNADTRILEIDAELSGIGKDKEALEAGYSKAQRNQKHREYDALKKNADFAEKSKYNSTEKDGAAEYNMLSGTYATAEQFGDIDYDYINKNSDAVSVKQANSVKMGTNFAGVDGSEKLEMTADEIAIYNYIYATEGAKAANEYVAFLTPELTERQRTKKTGEFAKLAEEKPVSSSIGSVLLSPTKGLSFIGQIADYGADGKIDQNANYNKFSYAPSAIRGTVAKEIEESGKWGKVGSFAYNLGMSMGDFLVSTAVSGGHSNAALAILGTAAAADTTIEAKDRGLSDKDAITLGIVAGAAEAVTEKLSIDALFDRIPAGKGAVSYVLKNVLSEAVEEPTSNLINTVADIIIAEDKSHWQMAVDAYKAQGLTEGEALAKALGDKAIELGLDAIGGALSGGVMSGIGVAGNSALNSNVKQTTEATLPTLPEKVDPMDILLEETSIKEKAPTQTAQELVDNAITQVQNGGSVTNSAAEKILKNPEAVAILGVDTNGLTASQQRAAVKSAVQQMVETVPTADIVDNIEIVDGTSAPGMTRNDRMSPSTNLFDTIIPENQNGVKENNITADTQNVSDDGLGAANKGFDVSAYNTWVDNAKDFQPQGEKAVRNASLPTVNLQGNATMKTGQTIIEAEATPDSRVPEIENLYVKGKLAYTPNTNKSQISKAVDTITDRGWSTALKDWTAEVRAGKVNDDLVALGAELINNGGNSDMSAKDYAELVIDYSNLVHKAAGALQAARVLKMLTPEGKLYGIQRSITNLNEELKTKAKEKYSKEIEISDALLEEYKNAADEEARDKVIQKMQRAVAKQIPTDFLSMWTALRYVNMLGNFKTQIRNIAGNTVSTGLRFLKDEVAVLPEFLLDLATKGKTGRTKSALVGRKWMKAANADFKKMEAFAMGDRKYGDNRSFSDEFMQGVEDARTIFKYNSDWGKTEDSSKLKKAVRFVGDIPLLVLEGYRRGTNFAMESGDMLFSRHNYARALAGYLKANGVKAEQFDAGKVDEALVTRAREYAIKQAQETTFRDNNAFSDWVSKIGRRKDTHKIGKALAEGALPFRKTPANVFVRALEYSPVGVLGTAYQTAKAISGKSDVTATQVIDSLAKNLTGTGLFVLGMVLRDLGLIQGGFGEDDEELERLKGNQEYSIIIPEIGTYTADWVSPASIILFSGAQLQDLISDEEMTWADLSEAFTSMAEPMMQMSMLSGVEDTLDNVKFSDNNLIQVAMTTGLGYLTQGLTNTLLGQIERTTEPNRMTYYTNPEGVVPPFLQKAVSKASAKVPFGDVQQTEYLDAFGETESNGNVAWRIFENFISPGYFSATPENKEFFDLLDEVHDYDGSNPFPDYSAPNKIKNKNTEYTLTQAEKETYQKERGETYTELVNMLLDTPNEISTASKSEILEYINTYSTAKAKQDFLETKGVEYEITGEARTMEKALEADDPINFLLAKLNINDGIDETRNDEALTNGLEILGTLNKKDKEKIFDEVDGAEKAATIVGAGLSVDDYFKIKNKYKELNEKKVDDYSATDKSRDFARWLTTQGYTKAQQNTARDTFTFWTNIPGTTERMDKIQVAGVDTMTAARLDEGIGNLKPEEGNKTVTPSQKYSYIASDNQLSEQQKIDVLDELIPDSEEATYDKFLLAFERGMPLDNFAEYYYTMQDFSTDRDEDNKEIKGQGKQDKVIRYIKSLDISKDDKDFLFRTMYPKSKKKIKW